jgi:hypothetical protein
MDNYAKGIHGKERRRTRSMRSRLDSREETKWFISLSPFGDDSIAGTKMKLGARRGFRRETQKHQENSSHPSRHTSD